MQLLPCTPPVELLINSSKLRAVFSAEQLKQLVPPQLEDAARARPRTRGAAVLEVEGAGDIRHVINVTKDEEIRANCISAGSTLS